MNSSIEKIMSQVLELEGLLLVADNHNGDVNPIVFKMIHEKADAISVLAQDISPASFNLPVEDSNPSFINSPVCNLEVPASEPVGSPIVDEEVSELAPDAAFKPEDLIVEAGCVHDDEIVDIDNDNDDDTRLADNDEETEEEFIEEEEDDDEVVEEYIEETEEEEEEEEDADKDDAIADINPDPEPADIDEADDEFIEKIEDDNYDDDDDEQIKLDEALQRNISKNLNKAFSLNDRFRYRRELFENNEMELKNALDLVEAMHSYSEAEDYFYGDLDWDRDSEEVKDFMAIIRNHFL